MEQKPELYIQWKGTDVCIDLECKCGWSDHFDGFDLYAYKCPECGTIYKLPGRLYPTEITSKEIEEWMIIEIPKETV